MAFQVIEVSSATAEAILVWCGVADPTPAEISAAQQAALMAEAAIRHYRGLDTAPVWKPETAYAIGDICSPTHPNEHLYLCTVAGVSSTTEPTWPITDNATVTDGTVTWTEHVRPMEAKYEPLAVEMGSYLYQKRGVDGVTALSENGVSYAYETGSFPPSMLSRITLPVTVG